MLNNVFLTLGYLCLLFPAFYLLGALAQPWLKLADNKMSGIVYFALGLGIFAYYAVAIGHLNLLNRPAILIFVALIYGLCWRSLRSFCAWLSEVWIFLAREKGGLYRLCLAAFLFTAALAFVLCFVPETANDSLCYQLNLPKVFARHHSTQPLFYDLNSQMPFLMQHLYSVALVLGSESLAKMFHWITGILLCLGVFFVVFQKTQRQLLSFFCALMLWLTPTCINEVTSAYVDVAVAFFLFLAMWLFRQGLKWPAKSLFFVGGVFLGFVVSTKLIALLWAAAFVLLFFGTAAVCCRKFPLTKMLLVSLLGGILGCGFWFARNWVIEGNPVFPYMESVFGGPSLGLVSSYARVGLPKTFGSFVLLPWNITFRPDVFDRGFWIGPFYLLALPFALWGAWKRREARFWFAVVLLSVMLWFFVVQNTRFLFPVLPAYLLCVGIGYDAAKNFKFFNQAWVKVAAGGLVAFLLLLTVYHYRYPLKVITGQWSSREYLEKMERSYSIAEWVNRNLPKDASIFNVEEVRQYYFDRDMVREIWFRARTNYDKNVKTAGLMAYLREKGFTHVLRVYDLEKAENKSRFEGFHYDALDEALANPEHSTRLVSLESENIKEARERYVVFSLKS